MKLKVRTQLGERAKAINLVNVGYKRQLSADLSAIFTISDLFERTKKPALREHTGFDGHYQRTQIGRIFYVGIVYLLGPSIKEQTDRVRLR